MALNIVARKVEIAKANNGGVVPYAAMTDIVESMKPTLPWLTKGMLRSHINKLNKEKIQKGAARPASADAGSCHFWTSREEVEGVSTS